MADICILTITQSVGIDSGVWQHLTELFIPDWIKEGFGMEWETKPFVHNVTKKPGCAVTNKHGNRSRISLQSLRNEDEVEDRFKGKAYSMIWVNELSKFKKRKTFATLKQCLRMPHLQSNDHLFLADTNPDIDIGKESWIYRLWYEFRTANPEVLKRIFPDEDPETLAPLQRALKLIEFTVDDNLWLTPEKKAQLRADFTADGPDIYKAYYLGQWVTASDDALFFKVFRPSYHVVGELETASDPDPEILVPEENCFELILSIDPGGVNCASAIMEKTFDKRKKILNEQEVIVDVPIIKMLDELVVVGHDFDLWDYIEQLVEKMDFWERVIGRPGKTLWNMWSDRSAFDMRVAFSERFWASYFVEASGGRIQLSAVERGRGSVNQRVDLFRKLLFEDRFFMSKSRCPNAIEMCKAIRRGKGTKVIAVGDRLKHIFDGITYGVGQELYDELRRSNVLNLRRETNAQSTLVSLNL